MEAAVRAFAILRTCLFAVLFMGTVGIYLPRYFGLLNGGPHFTDWRALGFVPLILGALLALRCAFAFAWTGLGTPAPFDAPRRLVVTGMYRYVRNPMYLGMALFLIGEWMLFGSDPRGAITYLLVCAMSTWLFVKFYEEPTLRQKFPADYDQYTRNVPRFWPRLHPWADKAKGAASTNG